MWKRDWLNDFLYRKISKDYLVLLSLVFPLMVWATEIDMEASKVCTITINSDNEANVFKKYLNTGANKGKFEFIELTKKGTTDWFSKACEEKIACDVLVISGHFSGGFFSDKNDLKLSLTELEEASCNKNCESILTRPSEVFLFGCNTLASKDADSRTADEYLRDLLAHGLSLPDAVRSVQDRYGAFGNSNRDTMKRIFKGVRNIYGFYSSAPLGGTIESRLEKYLLNVPNYKQHLLEIETKRAVDGLENVNQWISDNGLLSEALKGTFFYQCSGLQAGNDDPILRNICFLKLDERGDAEKLLLIETLLVGKESLIYAPTIIDYFKSRNPRQFVDNEQEVFERIKTNLVAKTNFLEGWEGLDPISRINYLDFLIKMEWKDLDEVVQIEKSTVLRMLKPPVSVFHRDGICGYYNEKTPFYQLRYADLDTQILNDKNAIFALSCIGIKDEKLAKDLEQKYLQQKKMSKEDEMTYMVAIAATEFSSALLDKYILEKLSKTKADDNEVGLYLARENKSQNILIHNRILDHLEKNTSGDDWGHTLSELKIANEKVIDRILNLPLTKSFIVWPALIPIKEKLNQTQIERLKRHLLKMSKEQLNRISLLVINSLPIQLKADVLIKAIDWETYLFYFDKTVLDEQEKKILKQSLITYLKKMSNEELLKKASRILALFPADVKLTEDEKKYFVTLLKTIPDLYDLPEILGNQYLEDDVLVDIFNIDRRQLDEYNKQKILRGNVRKNSSIHLILIDHMAERYSEESVKNLLAYEKIEPTVKGQRWLIENVGNSVLVDGKLVDQLFNEVGFVNEELATLYKGKTEKP